MCRSFIGRNGIRVVHRFIPGTLIP